MNQLEILLLLLAIFGGIDLATRGIRFLLSLFPSFLSVQYKIWRWLADLFTVPAFRRRAVATRVEQVLNQTAFSLQRHLPAGWVKRAKIRWVRHPKAAQFNNGEIVLRIRPLESPDHNLIQTLWIYFHNALFPDAKDRVPPEIVSAIALAIARASLEDNHRYLVQDFDDVFLDSIASGNTAILNRFADCVRLNECGLLMGPFVRELDYAASMARFNSGREALAVTSNDLIDHMLGFQPLLRVNKPEEEWSYKGSWNSYGFILVSKPADIRPGIEAYVRRAQTAIQKGVQRLYVIGRDEERDFVNAVIAALLSIRELKGKETFPLFRDYRGQPRGMGALLAVDEMLAKLRPSARPLQILPTEVMPILEGQDVELVEPAIDLSVVQRELSKLVEEIVVQLSDYERAWISLADLGSRLRERLPDFTPERYGSRNLMSVLKKLDLLEFDMRGAGPAKVVFVRLLLPAQKAAAAQKRADTYARVTRIVQQHANEDGWIFVGTLGHYVKTELRDFDLSDFGGSSMREFIAEIPALLLQERGEGHEKTYISVR